MTPPKGQKLADELARMMGWKPLTQRDDLVWWCERKCPTAFGYDRWQPYRSYDQCRIVEDWILDNGLIYFFRAQLWLRMSSNPAHGLLRTTPLQRCQAAWLAYKESTKGKK